MCQASNEQVNAVFRDIPVKVANSEEFLGLVCLNSRTVHDFLGHRNFKGKKFQIPRLPVVSANPDVSKTGHIGFTRVLFESNQYTLSHNLRPQENCRELWKIFSMYMCWCWCNFSVLLYFRVGTSICVFYIMCTSFLPFVNLVMIMQLCMRRLYTYCCGFYVSNQWYEWQVSLYHSTKLFRTSYTGPSCQHWVLASALLWGLSHEEVTNFIVVSH